MRYVVIDGQGGSIGREVIRLVRERSPEAEITAVGTNSIATACMMKEKPDRAGTGENAAVVALRTADVVIGPIGIVIADSMVGEITPNIAVAVGQSAAKKFLLPVNRCNHVIVGVGDCNLAKLLEQLKDLL